MIAISVHCVDLVAVILQLVGNRAEEIREVDCIWLRFHFHDIPPNERVYFICNYINKDELPVILS
jgi:hypothetical protein